VLTGMTSISLHMQWPLTSQSHGSVSQREQREFFLLRIKLHALIQLGVTPPSFKCYLFSNGFVLIAHNVIPSAVAQHTKDDIFAACMYYK
jgi:hypothetical protein